MATVDQCAAALERLAQRLQDAADRGHTSTLDRTLSCRISDLDVVFTGRLCNGLLTDVQQSRSDRAKVRLTMTGDDLLALVDGNLRMPGAWASGRVRIDASIPDMVKLRSVF